MGAGLSGGEIREYGDDVHGASTLSSPYVIMMGHLPRNGRYSHCGEEFTAGMVALVMVVSAERR